MKMVNAVLLSGCTGMLQKLIILFSVVAIVARNDHKPGCNSLNSMGRETIVLFPPGARGVSSIRPVLPGPPKQDVLRSMQV